LGGVAWSSEITRKAPAQAELRPTCAGASFWRQLLFPIVLRVGLASPYPDRDPHPTYGQKKELPVTRELQTDTGTDTYFFGSHFAQFAANSSTLSFVTGISSPLTKVEGGFLFSATMSYSISTDLVPHS
jgi:hypothetical protein